MTAPTTPQTLEQLLGLEDPPAGTPEPNDGKGLRAQLQAVLAENKRLKEQNDAQAATNRTRVAAEMVTKHNIPPVFQNLLLKEVGDADLSDEAVTKFVATYGEGWGAKAAEASTTPEQQLAAQQVQALEALGGGFQPGALFSQEAATSRFAEAKTAADVMRMVAESTQGIQLLE